MSARPIRLARAFLTVGGWTTGSRVLGFVRDMAMAAALGAGPAAEAFVIAFSLPNMFRRFFAEGAFNTAFVPMFSKRLEAGGGARLFAEEAFAGLTAVLIALTLVAQLAMPALVYAMAGGFGADPAKFDLTVAMSRVMFPYILFISLAALVSGVLNALGRFAAAAAAPILLNVILVGSLWLEDLLGGGETDWLSWAVLAAGVAQLAWVWVAAARAGFPVKLRRPRLTPDLRRLAVIALPAALAGGVTQVNLLVGRQVASFFDGAVAWLYYADRLYQLPLGVVGVAVGVVLLPALSRHLQAGDEVAGRGALNRATEFALVLTLPATVALLVIPMTIVAVLLERGAFGPEDTFATGLSLAIYAAGLPAFVLQKVISPVYFARENTAAPFRYALVSMGVNAVCAIGLAPLIGFSAAAVGTTLAAWVNLAQLYAGARVYGTAVAPDAALVRRALGALAASVVMGAGLVALMSWLGPWLAVPGWRIGALGILVGGGTLAFAIAALLCGAVDPNAVRAALQRGRAG